MTDQDTHRQDGHSLLDDLAGFVDRLDRNHMVAIYVPTTIDVAQRVDTTPFVL